jgi:hypothetical protein
MKIRACRGVCIGVDRHLKPGDLADLDAAQVTFLVGIGAVERVPDEPEPKPVAEAAPATDDAQSTTTEPDEKTGEKPSGKKKEK